MSELKGADAKAQGTGCWFGEAAAIEKTAGERSALILEKSVRCCRESVGITDGDEKGIDHLLLLLVLFLLSEEFLRLFYIEGIR